jgi:hypothetical protein
MNLTGDLSSRRLIVLKGILFLGLALAAAGLIWLARPSWQTAALLALFGWSAARFYYFLFYVLERYVDPRLKYAGIFHLLKTLTTGPKSSNSDKTPLK